ncbi:MAG: hypothetical protein IJI67_07815 [Clostridia bacterium]|nr:hypothetical protein [Clostridia bacterium]
MKKRHKLISIFLVFTMVFGMVAGFPVTSFAQDAPEYIERYWDENRHVVVDVNHICSEYTELSEVQGNRLGAGWYTVSENTTMPSRLIVDMGAVHLIVCDDTTLTLGEGIEVGKNASLSIYTQVNNSGKICADINRNNLPAAYKDAAIIGGGADSADCGDITIHGGILDLKTTGWTYGSVIGGAKGGSPNVITIYGGTIDLCQSGEAALLGGGSGACVSRHEGEGIRIFGGTLNAVGLQGGCAAGIGSGRNVKSSIGSIAIYGGTVTATGKNGAAGIGGGEGSTNGQVDIYGGTVTTSGIDSKVTGAGIGSGCKANQTEPIRIHGGTVVTSSHSGAGIGAGCGGDATEIEIDNANVIATVSAGGAGIGGGKRYKDRGGYGGNITIRSQANVVATSLSYGTAQDYVNRLNECIANSKMKLDDTAYGGGIASVISFLIEWFQDDLSGTGIGGGYNGSAGTISISDSKVTAASGAYAAAIGTGDEAISGCTINITNNANVTATAGTDAAAIGSGNEIDGTCNINIADATVTANGGAYGAGIGGGDASDGGNITITDSTVKAYAGTDAAGIGGGEGGDGGTIKMINANVYAEGKSYGAGIGNGEDGDNAAIEIYGNNSNIEAVAGGDGKSAAIGHGGNGIFYEDHIKLYLAPELKAEVGSDKDHTTVYYGDSRYQPLFSAKYAKIYVCRHENTEWRSDGVEMHVQYCLTCGMRFGSTAISHEWNSENICTVCGASAETGSITFTQTDSSGATVQTTVEGPKRAKIKTPACTHAPNGTEFVCWSDGYNYYGANYDIGVPSSGSTTLHAVYLPLKEVSYINQNGEADTVTARQLTSTDLILTGGWYVVENNLQAINTLKIDGDIHLILADGATFSFYQGFDYYDLEHIDCFATFQNCTSSLRVYGQAEQSGTLMIGNRHSLFDDFVQYGGVVDSSRGFFEAAKNCTIAGGTFKAMVLACDRAAVLGGNATIGNLPLNKSLQLGWQQKSDRIHFDALESENTSVVANQAFCDENGNVYKGSLSAAQVNAMAGKTLMPYLEHDYAQPEWVWSDEYTNAEAIFRCKDCTLEQTVNAKVTWEDEGNSRTSHAVCNFNGETYTDTCTVNILWNITVAETAHGTISADKAHAKAGEFVELTVTPDAGYALDTLQVSDSEGTPIEAEDNTFKMPASDVSVTGSFKITTHTVRWIVGGETVETDENAPYGETPKFNGTLPATYIKDHTRYSFSGWSDGQNVYTGETLPAVTKDVTYTAVYTAVQKATNGVSLTVGRDITSNYYVDYLFYDGAATVRYTYNAVNELEQNVPVTKTVDLENIPAEMTATAGAEKRLMLTVSQAPAQMAETTKIEILNANGDVIDTLHYSAKTYCDNVIAMSEEEIAAYTDKGAELRTLCHTMIAYGQAAQGVFDNYETVAVTCENEAVNAQIEAATATANHTVNNAGQIKFSGVSFVCTKDARLRFYLNTSEATSTPAAPTASTGNAALKYTLNGAEKQYFVEVNGINAADFNEQITVNYGGSTINFSVLDFAGIVLRDGSGASAALQHFAKTLVVYNTNALAFFGN